MTRFSVSAVATMAAVGVACLSGCTGVGPKYERPTSETPAEWRFKKAQTAEIAKESGAAFGPEVPAIKADWWTLFNDPKLNELAAQAMDYNQDIKLAVSRVDEARATARVAKADFFPQISLSPEYNRLKTSDNTGQRADIGGAGASKFKSMPYHDFKVPFTLGYEVDLWGRVRKGREAAKERAEATIADYQAVQLTVASDVAVNYMQLRALDSDVDVLRNALKLRQESLKLVESRFKFGTADQLDVQRAKSDEASNQQQLAEAIRQREAIVNVLAILCGKPAPSFELTEHPLDIAPPIVPAGLPSEMLQRRPDIYRAERYLAAANADIGIAKAAFFPRLALTATGGFESADLGILLHGSSLFWNMAANIVQPLFTGGRNRAELEAAKARYNQAFATYQQQVLVAFKDVQDSLVDIRYYADESKALADAVIAAREVTRLAQLRYEKGQVSYLDVVDAQRQQLLLEQQAAELLGLRLGATIRLIKALGGGWNQPVEPVYTDGPEIKKIESTPAPAEAAKQ